MSINKILRYGILASNIMLTSGLFVGAGVLLGLYVDFLLGSSPIFTIFLSVVGLVLGIWSLVSSVLKLFKQ